MNQEGQKNASGAYKNMPDANIQHEKIEETQEKLHPFNPTKTKNKKNEYKNQPRPMGIKTNKPLPPIFC